MTFTFWLVDKGLCKMFKTYYAFVIASSGY